MTHDIVVFGASAGGIEPLTKLMATLPRDLPASLFVTVHTHPSGGGRLADALGSSSSMAVTDALHGETIRQGRVYVAPADNHLIVRQGHVEVVHGPRENGHRPSVDVLFRSAAQAYGPRVIGVVLSGHQDCGTAGLLSIKARGGIAVAQSPEDARVPEMPASSIARVRVDHVVPAADLPGLLESLVQTPVTAVPPATTEEIVELEGGTRGMGTTLSCPTCHGALAETKVGSFEHFRCHVGHAFSLDSLERMQREETERALWAAVRALEDAAALSHRLASTATGELRARFADRGRVQSTNADVIRQLLLGDATRPSS